MVNLVVIGLVIFKFCFIECNILGVIEEEGDDYIYFMWSFIRWF